MTLEHEQKRRAAQVLAVRVLEGPALRTTNDSHLQEAKRIAKEILTNLGQDIAPMLDELTRLVFLAGGQRALLEAQIPFFAYDYLSDFELNAAQPWLPAPSRKPGFEKWRVFDQRVSTPFGVAASVLTVNARWIEFFSRTGCDFNTYKTVRSRQRRANRYPHWRILQGAASPYETGKFPDQFVAEPRNWPKNHSAFSTANSFGVPSEDPDFWQPDFRDARKAIASDQLLMLSVIGTEPDKKADADLATDFATTARLGEEAGAEIIELNLSCPNTIDSRGEIKKALICASAEATRQVVEKVRNRLVHDSTQVTIKVSWMNRELLREVTLPLLADKLIQGVAGINTMQAEILDGKGKQVFPGRALAGVSGAAIRDHAIDFVEGMNELRQEVDHRFTVVGIGGVLHPDHVRALLDAGADAVQSATGPFADPYLGLRVRDALATEELMPVPTPTAEEHVVKFGVREILDMLAQRGRGVKLASLRSEAQASEQDFEIAFAASVAAGLVALRNPTPLDIEARLTPGGRMVLGTS